MTESTKMTEVQSNMSNAERQYRQLKLYENNIQELTVKNKNLYAYIIQLKEVFYCIHYRN